MKALNNYIGAAGTIAAFEAVLVGKAFGLDPALMVDVINASTGYNSTTQRKIPQQVLTNAFASGFSAALMTKDVGIADGIAQAMRRCLRPTSKATSKLWRAALQAAAAGRRSYRDVPFPREAADSISRRSRTAVEVASKATSLHLSGWPAATGLSIFQPWARPSGRQPCASESSAGIRRPTTV